MSILDFIKRYGVICGGVLCIGSVGSAFAHDSRPAAIIGGQGPRPYGALLTPNGHLKTLEGLPPTGLTFRVAMNKSGEGIIVGSNSLDAYAALVSPKGVLTPLNLSVSPGTIYTCAINPSGYAIIGGGNQISQSPFEATTYAALVSPDGSLTPLSLPASGLIFGVAIDSSGNGFVGGIGPGDSAYAAKVSSNGTVTELPGLPSDGGIFWVAINKSETGLIGGNDGSLVYAAYVDPNGTVKPIANLPPGLIYSVALNDAGSGIIVGTSNSNPYAALVRPSGSVKTLSGLPTTTGKIYGSSINKVGAGLITGFSGNGPFSALISPEGVVKPLLGLPNDPNGFADGVAIHNSGVGIIGGTAFNAPFAALVAPNGTLTFLDNLPPIGEVNTIGLATLNKLVPESIGSYDSFANTLFAFSDALTQHSMIHHKRLFKKKSNYDQLYAYDGEMSALSEPPPKQETSSLWLSLFGSYVHEKKHSEMPAFSNKIAGVLAGYDYMGIRDVVIGGGLAYAFNNVQYFERLGHTNINQESAVLYASLNKCHFYMNAALWGGLSQAHYERRSFSFIKSRSSPQSWNLSPHLELSAPFQTKNQWLTVDPFVMFDFANNWQHNFHEHGHSGFNIKLKNKYASLFRSEAGLRFFENLQYCWGRLIIEEKASYVNRTPIHKGRGSAFFIGSASSFDVETFSRASQNLGVAQIHIEALPKKLKCAYGSFDYQGEFGSSFQSHMITLTIGKNF